MSRNIKLIFAGVAFILSSLSVGATELKSGDEFTLADAPEELTVHLKRGGSVRFLMEENGTTGYQWVATFASNECSVVIEHRGAGAKGVCGAPGKAAFSVTKNPSVQSPSLVEFVYCRNWEQKAAFKRVRLVLYTIPGEVVDFRYPASRTLNMLKAECKNRGIEIIDWHVHIRGGLTPELAAERERACGIRQSAMENHGREWEIFDNARLVEFANKARSVKVNGHTLPVGIQVNDRDWFRQIDASTRAKFDYILADTMIMGKLPNGRDKRLWLIKDLSEIGDPERWMDEYVQMNLQILDEPISILANPGYLPTPLDGMRDKLWTEERMRKVIGKAVERGIAIEIQAESPYPTTRFLKLAKSMGAKFSFGTNNYDAAPKDLSRWLEAIVWLDLKGEDIWTPEILSSRPPYAADRIAMLDLARQIEKPEVVCDYLHRVKSTGFNRVLLYLEDRVKTATYPYCSDDESYSAAEIGKIVDVANKLQLDLIPVVSPLGHTDRFLAHPELLKYSETADCAGRFGGHNHGVFCLEMPEARAWMEQYITEVAALFPGENFHFGFDETDDLGMCARCKPIRERDGLGVLYSKHVMWAHDLANKLGKRMWIWDDYFAFFPEEQAKLPRDIVMCAWNYCEDLERTGFRNNFGGRRRRDNLKEYELLGFEAVVCPWRDVNNQRAISEYAFSRKCRGVLATTWELAGEFFSWNLPKTLGMGELWQDPQLVVGDEWLRRGVARAMPSLDAAQVSTVMALMSDSGLRRFMPQFPRFATSPIISRASIENWKQALGVLKALPSHPGEGLVPKTMLSEEGLLDALVVRLEMSILSSEANNAARRLAYPERIASESRAAKRFISSMLPRWQELVARRFAQWQAWRRGKPSKPFTTINASYGEFVKQIMAISDEAGEDEWVLEADVIMGDSYGVPVWCVEGNFDGKWRELANGVWKASPGDAAYFAKYTTLKLQHPPKELRLSYYGYGAGEIAHLSIRNRNERWVPAKVLSVSGKVEHAEWILEDDFRTARLGNADCTASILNPAQAIEKSSLTLQLKK